MRSAKQQQQSFSVLSTSLQSFSDLHPELGADNQWFAGSAGQGNKATRSDVRLLKEFTTYLKSHKLELQVCAVRLGSVRRRGQFGIAACWAGSHGPTTTHHVARGGGGGQGANPI